MTALQLWLANHNKRLTQEAIDEALMEYIEMIEAENARLKAIISAENTLKIGRVDPNELFKDRIGK